MKKRKGFTLVELLVAIAIIGILAGVAILGYSLYVKKTNLSKDETVIKQMNDYIKAYEVNDKVLTTSDARDILLDSGVNLETLKPSSTDYRFAYDIVTKEFCLISNKWKASIDDDKNNIFAFVSNEEELNKANELGYAAYMQADFFSGEKDVEFSTNMSVDTGVNEIKVFNYINLEEANKRNSVLVVNAESLNVDAPYDTITHYGVIKTALDIVRVANDSYIENGTIEGNVFIASGHFIVGEGSVKYIIVTGENVQLDGITADHIIAVFNGYIVEINGKEINFSNYQGSEFNVIYMVDAEGKFIAYDENDPMMILAHKFAGLGTKEHPFLINSAEDYIRLQEVLEEYYYIDFPDVYFKQTADIEMRKILNIDPDSKIHIDLDGHTLTIHQDDEFGKNVIFDEDKDEEHKGKIIIDKDAPLDDEEEDKKNPGHTHEWVFVSATQHQCTSCSTLGYHTSSTKDVTECKCGLISIRKFNLINKSGSEASKVIYRLTKDNTVSDALTLSQSHLDIYLSGKKTTLEKNLKITGSNINLYGDKGGFNASVEISGKNIVLDNVVISGSLTVKKGASVTINGENSKVSGDLIVEEGGQLVVNDGTFKDDPYNYLNKEAKNARQIEKELWQVVDASKYVYPVMDKATSKEYRTLKEALQSAGKELVFQDVVFYKGIIDSDIIVEYDVTKLNKIYPNTGYNIRLDIWGEGSLIKKGKYNVNIKFEDGAKIDCSLDYVAYFNKNDIKYDTTKYNAVHDYLFDNLTDKNNYMLTFDDVYYSPLRKNVNVQYGSVDKSFDYFYQAYEDALANAKGLDVKINLYCSVTYSGDIKKNNGLKSLTVNSRQDASGKDLYGLRLTYITNVIETGTYNVQVDNEHSAAKCLTGGTFKYDPTDFVDRTIYFFSKTNPWVISKGVAVHNNVSYGSFEDAYEASKKTTTKYITLLDNVTYTKSKFNYDAIVNGDYTLTFTNANTIITRGTFNCAIKVTNDADKKFLAGGKYKKNTFTDSNLLGECELGSENGYVVVYNTYVTDTFTSGISTWINHIYKYSSFEEAYDRVTSNYKYITLLYDIPCNISITKDVCIKGRKVITEGKYELEIQGADTYIMNGVFIVGLTTEENIKPIRFGSFYYDPSSLVADGFKTKSPSWIKYINSDKGYSVSNYEFIVMYDVPNGESFKTILDGYETFKDAYDAVPSGKTGYTIGVFATTTVNFDLTKDITYITGGDYELQVATGKTISAGTYNVAVNVEGVKITHGLFNKYYNAYFETQVTSESGYVIEKVNEDLYYNVRSAVARVNGKGYLTFNEAYKAASNGDTIELLTNCTDDLKLSGSFTKNVTVSGASYYLEVENEITNGIFLCGIQTQDYKISGGEFAYGLDANDIKNGYMVFNLENGHNAVGKVVAYIGSKPYPSFDKAYEAAVNGTTIRLVESQTTAKSLTINNVKIAGDNTNVTLTCTGTVNRGIFDVKVIFSNATLEGYDEANAYCQFKSSYVTQATLEAALAKEYCVATKNSDGYYYIVKAKVSYNGKGYSNFNTPYNLITSSGALTVNLGCNANIYIDKNITVTIADGRTLTLEKLNGQNTVITTGTYTGAGKLVVKGNITGGTFNNTGGFEFSNGTITGGTFTYDVSKYLTAYYCQVDGKVQMAKASVNGKGYISFEAAYNAATNGQTITLYANAEYNKTICSDKNITVKSADGTNYTLTLTESIYGGTYDVKVIYNRNSANNQSLQGGSYLASKNTIADFNGKVHSNYALYIDGNYIRTGEPGVSYNDAGYYDFASAYAVYTGGTIVLKKDQTFNQAITKDVAVDCDGHTLTIASASTGTYYGNVVTVNSQKSITGGKYKDKKEVLKYVYTETTNHDMSAYIASGYVQDGAEVILGGAILNGVAYVSFDDAYNAANGGDVIYLQKDQTCNIKIGANHKENTDGKNVVVENKTGNHALTIKQSVYGGTYNVNVVISLDNGQSIQGGKFSTKYNTVNEFGMKDESDKTYTVHDDYIRAEVSGYYEVGIAVASYNGVRYTSLYEAYKATPQGETLKVLTDVAVVFKVEKNIVFDASYEKQKFIGSETCYYTIIFYDDVKAGVYNSNIYFMNGAKVSTGAFRSDVGAANIASNSCQVTVNGVYVVREHSFTTYASHTFTADCSQATFVYKCEYCNNSTKSYTVNTTNQITTKTACDHPGERTYTATYGTKTVTTTKPIEQLSHSMNKTEAHAATCTAAGNIAYWTCSTCINIYSDANGSTKITQAQTVQNALGHNYTVSAKWNDNYSCELNGVCSRDNSHKMSEVCTLANGKVTSSQTKAPTCQDKGETTYKVTYGGKDYTKTYTNVNTVDHNYIQVSEHSINNFTSHGYASPTCQHGPQYYTYCSYCGENSNNTNTIYVVGDAIGHNWQARYMDDNGNFLHQFVAESKYASCTSDGVYYYNCPMCNQTRYSLLSSTERKAVDVSYKIIGVNDTISNYLFEASAPGHTANMSVKDGKYTKTAATCQNNGTYYYQCVRCSTQTSETYSLSNIKQHNYTFDQFVWSGYTAQAKYSCKNGCSGVNYYDATVTSSTTKSPTCTATGVKTYTASYKLATEASNHTAQTTETLNMIAHVYDKQIATDQYRATYADCVSVATYYKSCYCGASSQGTTSEVKFNSGSTTGHNYASQVASSTYLKTAATHAQGNEYYYKCTGCTAKGSTTWIDAASIIAHTFNQQSNSDLVSAQTCTNGAVYRYTCSCGAKSSSASTYTYGTGKGHTYNQQSNSDLVSAQTCTSGTVYRYTCSCGAKSNSASTYTVGSGKGHDMTHDADAKYATNTYITKVWVKCWGYKEHCKNCTYVNAANVKYYGSTTGLWYK